MNPLKVVGHRRHDQDSPEECVRRGAALAAAAAELRPRPRPRGFVFKARTWQDKEEFERKMRLGLLGNK